MNKDEKSLLLYLETRVVDHDGLVDLRHMNADDVKMAQEWDENGFIGFGRVIFSDIERFRKAGEHSTHWCTFSEAAWHYAHQERKAKAKRMYEKRTWKKTSEKNN